MLTEIKNTIGRLFIASLLLGAALIVYCLFILRGREADHFRCADDPLWNIVRFMRSNVGSKSARKDNLASTNLTYSLRELSGGRIERKIINHSWRPFLVTMYEFKNWKYALPDKKLLHYASRYIIKNQRTGLTVDSGARFGCGTGLGNNLIRPRETFTDTIGTENLIPYLSLRDQLKFSDDETVYDRLTGEFIGDPLAGKNQYDAYSLYKLVPDDELEVRLYLPVTDYFNGKREKVLSKGISISRWEALERGR